MKVSVITRHAISNYGSLLQTIATQDVISRQGHVCEIVDYIREDEHYRNIDETILAKKPEWNNNLIKRNLYLLLRKPASIIAGKSFEKNRKTYLNLSRRYTSLEDLQKDKPVADVYMTGSDQVWGPIGDGKYDSAYLLSYTDVGDRCIAYAASFGHTSMEGDTKEFFFRELHRYEQIAVREDKAVEMLGQLEISAKQVLDPTLLLDTTYWDSLAARKPREENYILIYQLHNNPELNEYAKAVAKKTGKKLIRISASLHQITRAGKMVFLPSPGEFLGYIKYADCLITDSFHGTAFAINLNTNFVEVLPTNGTSSRNVSLLRLLGLTNRLLADGDLDLVSRKIDYDKVNKRLEELREESLEHLRRMLRAE